MKGSSLISETWYKFGQMIDLKHQNTAYLPATIKVAKAFFISITHLMKLSASLLLLSQKAASTGLSPGVIFAAAERLEITLTRAKKFKFPGLRSNFFSQIQLIKRIKVN